MARHGHPLFFSEGKVEKGLTAAAFIKISFAIKTCYFLDTAGKNGYNTFAGNESGILVNLSEINAGQTAAARIMHTGVHRKIVGGADGRPARE